MKIKLRLNVEDWLPLQFKKKRLRFLCFEWQSILDSPFIAGWPSMSIIPDKDDEVCLSLDPNRNKHSEWEINFTPSKRKIDLIRREIIIECDDVKFYFKIFLSGILKSSEKNSLIKKLMDCGWTLQ